MRNFSNVSHVITFKNCINNSNRNSKLGDALYNSGDDGGNGGGGSDSGRSCTVDWPQNVWAFFSPGFYGGRTFG